MTVNYLSFLDKIRNILECDYIKVDEPMKHHTTFKVGGPCDLMVFPRNKYELLEVMREILSRKISYFVLGGGSNVLVKKGGFRGVVVNLNEFKDMKLREHNIINVSSGCRLYDVSEFAYKNSLSGFEFACGIPGTIGGAVAMNAGAYGGEMSHVVSGVSVIDDLGEIRNISKEDMQFSYRSTIVSQNKYTVIDCDIILNKGCKENIRKVIDELNFKRQDKQPLEFASAGSTFKRPQGYYAGKLIEDSGLRGFEHKNAMVSNKHCGFVINKGNADSNDILELIEIIQKKVYEKFSVKLELEVRVIGED